MSDEGLEAHVKKKKRRSDQTKRRPSKPQQLSTDSRGVFIFLVINGGALSACAKQSELGTPLPLLLSKRCRI